jgi:hypothetical protein
VIPSTSAPPTAAATSTSWRRVTVGALKSPPTA